MFDFWQTSPISLHLEYLSPASALALFAVLASVTIGFALASFGGRPSPRHWVAASVRLILCGLLVFLVAGAQWEQRNDDLEVIVVRDVSRSTDYVHKFPGKTLQASEDQWLSWLSDRSRKPAGDSIGVVSFDDRAWVDAMPGNELRWSAGSIRGAGGGTDAAAAINLARALGRRQVMHRLVLIWDGNATTGDLDGAIDAAAAAHVPIDVVPLHYRVDNAVVIDKFIAPTWRRQHEPFSLDVVLHSTARTRVTGALIVSEGSTVISKQRLSLPSGTSVQHVKVPAQEPGLVRFHAAFEPDLAVAPADAAVTSAPDLCNADVFSFIRGKGRILYVDGVEGGHGRTLENALAEQGIVISDADHVRPERFPNTLADLQGYDAVILANVSRGSAGLSELQDKTLASYVRDTGGGLLVIGGPEALGAGGWIGSAVEKILPVDCSVPATRSLPVGGLMLVIDRSGSMGETIGGSTASKEQIANEAAVLALRTLTAQDYFGVIAFDSSPYSVVSLRRNADPDGAAVAIRSISPNGGTEIYPALVAAYDALSSLAPEQVAIRHVILLTDGDSQSGDYPGILKKMNAARITLSTVAVGDDADRNLLAELAKMGKGRFYPVPDPRVLPRIFVREASVLRRPLIEENPGGIQVFLQDSSSELTAGLRARPVDGMLLTSRKPDPLIEVPLVAGRMHDPLLARWQVGLGRAVVFTSDATARWAPEWVASAQFGKFWAELVRSVERPPADSNVELRTSISGNKGRLEIEALNADGSYRNFLSASATLIGPDLQQTTLDLVQTGPGMYTTDFSASTPWDYVALVNYRGSHGEGGVAVGGVAVTASRELRDLQSNEAALQQVAARTGGRALSAFDPAADLFSRDGLRPSTSVEPLWGVLLPAAMATLLVDVAVRRLALDRESIRSGFETIALSFKSHAMVRPASPGSGAEALRRARHVAAVQTRAPYLPTAPAGRPNPKARFTAAGVEGEIGRVLGGAASALPPPRSASSSQCSLDSDFFASLRRAKTRAREQTDKTGG